MLCPSLQCKLFLLGQSNKIASLCCLYCLEGPQSLAADNTTACSTVHDVHHVVLWFVAGVKPVHGSMRQPQPVLAAASYEQQALAKILCKLNWQLATPCGEWGGEGGSWSRQWKTALQACTCHQVCCSGLHTSTCCTSSFCLVWQVSAVNMETLDQFLVRMGCTKG